MAHGGAWMLDAANTCNEVLVLLAREAKLDEARNELIIRQRPHIEKWIRVAARRMAVAELAEDAVQEAVFWTGEAIDAYNISQISVARGCSFRTFLRRVVEARFIDFVRAWRRRPPPRRVRCDNAADNITRHELLEHVRLALAEAGPFERALWRGLCSGQARPALARDLGVSVSTLQRRWRRLATRLTERLRRVHPFSAT